MQTSTSVRKEAEHSVMYVSLQRLLSRFCKVSYFLLMNVLVAARRVEVAKMSELKKALNKILKGNGDALCHKVTDYQTMLQILEAMR